MESQRAREEEARAIDTQIGDSGSERPAMPCEGRWYDRVDRGKRRMSPTTTGRVVTTAVTCNRVLRVEMEWLEDWLL